MRFSGDCRAHRRAFDGRKIAVSAKKRASVCLFRLWRWSQENEAADVEREREERDVARGGREDLIIERAQCSDFQKKPRDLFSPPALRRKETRQKHVL